eukprot:7874983-Pyramimonas_sp.AAC.1
MSPWELAAAIAGSSLAEASVRRTKEGLDMRENVGDDGRGGEEEKEKEQRTWQRQGNGGGRVGG